jgi:hypothetical protein
VVWQQVSLWTGLQVCVFEDWVSLSPVGAGRDFACLDCGEHLTISCHKPELEVGCSGFGFPCSFLVNSTHCLMWKPREISFPAFFLQQVGRVCL